jgi:transcriptional regulator with PAS, ATPase and Fis domain
VLARDADTAPACARPRRVPSSRETKARRVDVRFVCATHRADEVFREDFRGRLKMIVLIAPLRERREDIALLIRHLLVPTVAEYPERRERLFFEGPNGRLEPRLMLFFVDYLVRHPLKRNTRELTDSVLSRRLQDQRVLTFCRAQR